ncbi:MAG: DNA polymerase III subunit gamma/tau [Bacteroidales bacterium]|nr:DNA polymerase III subunit gamma/tau [Bacteroidales bacterium]MBN2750361.1 DNA polymerase III subunit gamma/tau [Bacteroidales bacterium]
MENFVVSARKYRPSTFISVVGQTSITTTLKNAIQRKQLAQAYLFCGPRGVGKTTCARIFAKTINCLTPTADMEACNECESCKAFNSSRSFNIHELDAASNNSVDGIRNLIDQVRIPPQLGRYSVYIIDEVHMLTTAAFNAFLKTLEEPPAHAVFILATTEKHKIIPTILSRCQIFDFNRIRVEDMVGFLAQISQKENVTYEVEALNIISQKADGAMRDALSIFDQVVSFSDGHITYQKVIDNLNVLDYQYYFKLTEDFIAGDFGDALRIFDELLSKGFDAQQFVSGLSIHLRNLLVCKNPQTLQLLEVGAAIAERYKQMASQAPPNFLIRALDVANQCDVTFRQSSNQRLHVELMLIRLSELNQQKKNELTDNQVSEPKADAPQAPQSVASRAYHSATGGGSEAVKPIPKVAPKSISIRDAMSGKAAPEATKPKGEESRAAQASAVDAHSELASDSADDIDDTDDLPLTTEVIEFTQQDLEREWKRYAALIKTSKASLHSLLEMYSPVVTDSFHITITLESTIQQELFSQSKGDLIKHLRKALHNNLIDIIEVVDEKTVGSAKPYTADDKFKFMCQKNPTLVKLRQQLNLDFS